MKQILFVILIALYSCKTKEHKIQNETTAPKDTTKTTLADFQSDKKSDIITIPTNNITFQLTNRNDSIFYTSSTHPIETLIIAAEQENGDFIGEFKTIVNNGNKFLLINIASNGTAGYNTEKLMLLDTVKGNLENVDIKYATTVQKAKLKTGEEIYKDEYRAYYNDSVVGLFSIGLKTDPAHSSSVREVKTWYRIVKDNGIWMMEPETMIFTNNNKQ